MKPKTANVQQTASPKSESDHSRRHDSDNEDSVGGKECGICHDVPENIIYLSCAHIVCLVCAAKSILGAMGEDSPINLGEVTCGICEEVTTLSEGVQETMIEFLGQQEFEDEDGGAEEEEDEDEGKAEAESQENSVQIKSSNSRRRASESNEPVPSTQRERETKNDSVVHNHKASERQKKKVEEPKEVRRPVPPKIEEPKGASRRGKETVAAKPNPKQSAPQSLDRRRPTPVHTTENDQQESDEAEAEEDRLATEDRTAEEQSDFLSTFYCAKHSDEEYTYYHPLKRTLLCSQCLLTEIDSREDRAAIRPLKKCLPEILQNFQDMLNEIEVARSLLENKRKDFEIRKEGAKIHAVSMAKKLELAFDELLDFVQEVKLTTLKSLEARNKALLSELEGKEDAIEERTAFFSGVLDEVSNLRQNSQNPEEELFVFFFANQERISRSLETESIHNADSEAVKINRIFEEFTAKTKQEQVRLSRVGQETIREKLNKNIAALGGISLSELPDTQKPDSKLATLAAEFQRTTAVPRPALGRVGNTLVTLAEAENSTRYANLQPENEGRPSSKNGAPYTASQTYGQFVEKVKALPSRNTNSVDVNKYASQVRGLSRGALPSAFPVADSNGFSKDFTASNYYKTMNKNSYNIEKKLELEQKLKFFDLKGRKEDGGSSGYSSALNRTGLSGTALFQQSGSIQKSRLDMRNDLRVPQPSSYTSSLRSGGWMSGKGGL